MADYKGTVARRFMSAATLALVGATLVACGSGDDGGADSGDAVRIMVVGQFENPVYARPEGRDIVRAVVDRVNAEGGVNGKDIDLIVCDDKRDPNGATQCARQAVSEKVVAVLSTQLNYSESMQPVLTGAKIPFIKSSPTALADMSDKNTWLILSGLIAGGGAAGLTMAADGCENVGTIASQVDSSNALADAIVEGYRAGGGDEVAERINTPATGTPDLVPVVAQLENAEIDCVGIAFPEADTLKLGQVLAQTSSKIRVYGAAAAFNDDVVAAMDGKVAVRATSDLPPLDDASLDQFRADAETGGADPNAWAAQGWVLADAFMQALSTVDRDATGPAVTEALGQMAALKVPGLPDVDLTTDFEVEQFARLLNRSSHVLTIKDGKLASVGEPVDTSQFFEAYADTL